MEQLGQPAPSAAGPAHAAPDGTVPIESGWALALDVWAENYLWLLPGETRQVALSWRHSQPIDPQVLVNGYNLPRAVQGP